MHKKEITRTRSPHMLQDGTKKTLNTMDPPKIYLFNRSKLEQILATSLRRKNENKKERERESGRDFGIVTIAESRCVMRGG
jgi:hypothetical protein